MAPLSSHFVSSSVNKFYAIGNKIIVNASVFLDSTPETQSVTVRPTLQKQLSYVIQQRNNNLGISRLWIEGLTNPIPAILGNCYISLFFILLPVLNYFNMKSIQIWMNVVLQNWMIAVTMRSASITKAVSHVNVDQDSLIHIQMTHSNLDVSAIPVRGLTAIIEGNVELRMAGKLARKK